MCIRDREISVEDEKLYNARIIKLTLQPLVENAIFSGIEPMGENGIISIHVKKMCIRDRISGVQSGNDRTGSSSGNCYCKR